MFEMSVTLFFGIRLSDRPYKRIAHKLDADAFGACKVEHLKKLLVGELLENYSDPSTLELIYCGSVLDDSVELTKEGIEPGSTIHVFQKNEKKAAEPIELSEEDIMAASSAYRSVCFNSPGKCFPKVVRPEVINKVLEKYPEFYNDTGAYAILRDAVLLEKMISSPQAKQIGEQYPLLITSAKFVAETMISHLTPQISAPEDSSDSTSDQDISTPRPSPNQSESQRISRGQLTAALLSAVRGSLSSSQRRVEDEEMATTSSTTPPNTGTSSVQSSDSNQQYAAELQTMRDMGLMEENSNLQALIICNGNIEAAVTLVLGGNFA
ncbi:Ubiquitin-like protein 7 [Pseudolycoriella hygida]|uniref:Ubiquitin-like protein 7 n=1 Tax=Pseudolycoriella hygida TaxID=35572 RepID=A0A9Q0MT78_9DIPT|nr:Ubiquitin-like protein 7 [Pseudolycoriella hygida]